MVREETLRSAFERIRFAVLVYESQILAPFNSRGKRLFDSEGLRGDLVEGRPSHPLSHLLTAILEGQVKEDRAVTLRFPSGHSYRVELTHRSAKGPRRLIILFFEPAEGIAERLPIESLELTGRETEVGHAILRGLSNQEIADLLGVSANTVKTHVAAIMAKARVRTRGELIARFGSVAKQEP